MDIDQEKARAGHSGDGVSEMLGWSLLLGLISLSAVVTFFVTRI